jgi:hypothetical protein
MNIKSFISSLKTYWLQISAVLSILGAVYSYGVSSEKVRTAEKQGKIEYKELKDSTIFYYKALKNEYDVNKKLTQQTFDTVNRINKKLTYYSLKVDLLTESYKQSLGYNREIDKNEYIELTKKLDGIQNLLQQLNEVDMKIEKLDRSYKNGNPNK